MVDKPPLMLTKELLFRAITQSIRNAESLIEDGRILSDYGRYARAYTMYHLAIEEIGKASLTAGFLLFEDYKDIDLQTKFFKGFCDHKKKIGKSIGLDHVLMLVAKSNDTKKALLENSKKQCDNISKLNDLKNYSLYTSLIGDDFHTPMEVISEERAKDLALYADLRCKIANQFYPMVIEYFDGIKEEISKMDIDEIIEEGAKELKQILHSTQ